MEGKVIKNSPLSVTGMIIGAIGICVSFIPEINYLSYILGILAMIFAIIGLIKNEINGENIAALLLGTASLNMLGIQEIISSLSDWRSDGSELIYPFYVLCWSAFWGIITEVVEKKKGINGFWYGFCLGLFGLIIVDCVKIKKSPTAEPKVIVSNTVETEDKFKTLEKLHELKTNGVITEEEYIIEKNKILH